MAVLLAGSPLASPATAKPVQEARASAFYPKIFFQKRVNLAAKYPAIYGSEASREMLEALPAYGVNAVALVPYRFAVLNEPRLRGRRYIVSIPWRLACTCWTGSLLDCGLLPDDDGYIPGRRDKILTVNRLSDRERKWIFFWSYFYGLGAPLYQVLFIVREGFLNQFGLADFVAGGTMLVSVAGLHGRRPWAELLNAIAWGAFLAIFISALSYFALFLKERTPPAAPYLIGLGLLVSVSCLLLHLRAARS